MLALLLGMTVIAQHNAGNNGKILMIASNPSVSKTTDGPLVFGTQNLHIPTGYLRRPVIRWILPAWKAAKYYLMDSVTRKTKAGMLPLITFHWALRRIPVKWR